MGSRSRNREFRNCPILSYIDKCQASGQVLRLSKSSGIIISCMSGRYHTVLHTLTGACEARLLPWNTFSHSSLSLLSAGLPVPQGSFRLPSPVLSAYGESAGRVRTKRQNPPLKNHRLMIISGSFGDFFGWLSSAHRPLPGVEYLHEELKKILHQVALNISSLLLFSSLSASLTGLPHEHIYPGRHWLELNSPSIVRSSFISLPFFSNLGTAGKKKEKKTQEGTIKINQSSRAKRGLIHRRDSERGKELPVFFLFFFWLT